jgi:predicted nucleic acid-binding protein
VIDLGQIDPIDLPLELAISAVTLAELASGLMRPPTPRSARVAKTGSNAEATFEPLPMDGPAAQAYGRVYATVAAAARKARGGRAFDLLIAATALARDLPLYTSEPYDFKELDRLLEVVAVSTR